MPLGHRKVINSLEILQQNDYYAFGKRWENTSGAISDNRFLYNGKENQTTGALRLLDYGARMNDVELGRWFVIDPLAEKYYPISPYVFCVNNPIIFVDPDGEDLKIYYKSNDGKSVSFTYTGTEKNIPNNSFVQSVITAVNYNINNGGGGPTQKALGSGLTLIVQQTDGVSIHAYGNIHWNPEMGVETDTGNILSPATILDHEIDHGVQKATNPNQYYKDTATKDQAYDNKEEVRVITGSEQVTAKSNGEIKKGKVTRTNHNKGRTVITNGVTSTEINETKTNKFKENERKKMESQSIEW